MDHIDEDGQRYLLVRWVGVASTSESMTEWIHKDSELLAKDAPDLIDDYELHHSLNARPGGGSKTDGGQKCHYDSHRPGEQSKLRVPKPVPEDRPLA
eukprot:3348863-Rhodomonas_salina.1